MLAPRAWAGGQYTGDNGSQGAQRAGAFVARADDPTALWHNPAGLARATGSALFFGVNVIGCTQRYRRAGSYAAPRDGDRAWTGEPFPVVANRAPPQPVPLVAAWARFGRVAVGAGILAPHGFAARDYPLTLRSGAPAPQRYDAVEQRGVLVLPSVGAAVDLGDRVAVGARVSYGFGRFQALSVVQGVANEEEDPRYDSVTATDVSDRRILAAALGLQLRIADAVELGAAWHSPIVVDARGTSRTRVGPALAADGAMDLQPVADADARCAPGGRPEQLRTCLRFRLPQTAAVGIRIVARDAAGAERGDLELDVRWQNWSAASRQTTVVDARDGLTGAPVYDAVVRHGLHDTYAIRLGGAWRPRSDRDVVVRAGIAYETAAAPASWARVDIDSGARFTGAAGIGVAVTDRLRLDVGASVVEVAARRIDDVPVADPTDPASRVQPDVPVPLRPPDQQPYNPLNPGLVDSYYVIGSVGGTVLW